MTASMARTALLLTASLALSHPVYAAISPKAVQKEMTSTALASTRAALRLPLAERMVALGEQGPQGYKNLRAIMDDDSQGMEARWRAVTALGLLGGQNSKPELEQALRHKVWYMRNAGLVAMTNVDKGAAANWAKRLLSDKALVVRAAAVDTLGSLDAKSASPLLWQKLNAPENFKGKQSLFIRRRIVETLARLERQGQEAKFIAVLGDRDESLHLPAIRALERITMKTLGEDKEPVSFKKSHWQRWWKERSSPATVGASESVSM